VIVENFRPASWIAWSGYESLAKENPKLIFAAMSGMGVDGPFKDVGAFDLTIQPRWLHEPDRQRGGQPIKLGTSAFDLVCGQYAMARS
jgi:succinate--hydroxymethylglutarate CoA-transferase